MGRPPSASTRLATATNAAEEAAQQLARLKADRDAALLADRDDDADRLAGQIKTQEQHCATTTHKVKLLKEAVEREDAERRAREREKLILRLEKKFSERDQVAAELSDTIEKAAGLFQKLFTAARELRAQWPWQHYETAPTLIADNRILAVVEHELFRLGAKPNLLGATGSTGVSFPGCKPPSINLALNPAAVMPLTDVMRAASSAASQLMRTGKMDGTVAVADVPPPPQSAGAKLELSEQEKRLAHALEKMREAGDDISDEGEARYQDALKEVAAAQADVDAFKGLAANTNGVGQ